MKRSLLIGSGLAIAVSASAVEVNEVVTRTFDANQPTRIEKSVIEKTMNHDSRVTSMRAINTADGKYAVYPVMGMPETPFYMPGLSYASGGSVVPLCVPTNTGMKFKSNPVVEKVNSGAPSFSDWSSIQSFWTYYDPQFWSKDHVIEAEGDEILVTYPPIIDYASLPAPELSIRYEDEEDVADTPYELVFGGQGILPLNSGNGVELTALDFCTFAGLPGINYDDRRCPECTFGNNEYEDAEGEMTTSSKRTIGYAVQRYADAFQNEFNEALASVEINGWGFNLPYGGQPYLLRSIDAYAWASFTKDVKFTINVHEADEEGLMTDNIIYTTDVVVGANADDPDYVYRINFPVEFTSEDADGFEVDYIVVDKPLFIEFTGFVNQAGLDSYYPWIMGYDTEKDYDAIALPCTAATLLTMKGANGSEIKNYQNYYNYWRWGTIKTGEGGKDETVYYGYKQPYVQVVAEYPYMTPKYLYIDNENSEIEYSKSGKYYIEVPDGAKEVALDILTSATDPDEVFINGENLPDFVKVGVFNGIGYQEGNNFLNFLEPQFDFGGQFKDASFELPILYKNVETTIVFTNGNSGVNDVVAPANGKAEFFDLQGRKLNGNPEKGIYIKKEGNKASKLIL